MSAVVTFDFAVFAARFPEFAAMDPALAQMYFDEATLFFNNTGYGAASNASFQSMILNLLVAHLMRLYQLNALGQPVSNFVGRMNHAQEGSVSVGADLPAIPNSAAWFAQTQYGFEFWSVTSIYRRFRYRRGPIRQRNPYAWPY